MSTGPVAGHGVVLSFELDPIHTAGVFTQVARITSNIDQPKHDKPETNIQPHEKLLDEWMVGSIVRDVLSVTATFDFDNSTHDHVTGAQALYYSGVLFGVKMQGPTAPNGNSTGYWMGSGYMKTFQIKQPNLQGPRDIDLSIRFSGPEIIFTPANGAIRFG